MATITSLAPGAIAKITIAFSIGRYGWSESYYHSIGETGLAGLRDLIGGISPDGLAAKRLRLCGYGVFMDAYRISDVAVRRDADDTTLNFRATNDGDTSVPEFTFVDVKTAYNSPAINPNVCIVTRVEGANKVYHSAHPLGGCPVAKFTSGERLVNLQLWSDQFERYRSWLTGQTFLFPVLNRDDAGFADVPVTSLGPANVVGMAAVPGSWALGDRVRIINAIVPGRRRGGSIIGSISNKTATNVTIPPDLGGEWDWRAGPKTLAHKEETKYVPIVSIGTEYASHRNRGRPLFSPRGRRSRAR